MLVLSPTNRFATAVLAAGAFVLLVAIAVGERMGDRVLGQATEHTLPALSLATPAPGASGAGLGPDWKRSETLSAAPDPRFPDPRVPPRPLPTPLPAATSAADATPTPNPNVPVWRQQGMPTATPIPLATFAPELTTPEPSPTASSTPAPGGSPPPD